MPEEFAASTSTRPDRELALVNAMREFDTHIVIAAVANDLKPAIEAQRRLIARWSCSTILFEYFAAAHLDGLPLQVLPPQ